MKKIILSLWTLLCIAPFSGMTQDGAFHMTSGEQLSDSEWKTLLPEKFNLFGNDELLPITIESDFKNLSRRKFKDEYQEAMLHYHLNDSILVKRTFRIKPRGEFRKKYCHFPPIRLNFKKTDFLIADLQELEKLKMVTNCQNSYVFENYLLREYLVYKLYNVISDMSFKVRLLKVKYIDTGRKNKERDTYAFLIEDLKKLAERNDAFIMEQENLSQPHTVREQMTIVAMFNYMIGNTDWSVPGQHNIKLIRIRDLNKPNPYPVPYDFDYSGFVNTTYAIPTEGLGIKNVRERLFQGYCRTDEEFQAAMNVFLEKEEAIMDVINDFPYLGKRDKKDLAYFIQDFYTRIRKPKANEYLFQKTCKN